MNIQVFFCISKSSVKYSEAWDVHLAHLWVEHHSKTFGTGMNSEEKKCSAFRDEQTVFFNVTVPPSPQQK